jgi:oligopeptide/dipeptide ABC transporter ATP-binding protein
VNEILTLKGLTKTYRLGKTSVAAVRNIDLTIRAGETFGLVGESGCGKSTLGKLVLRLEKPSSGEIYFHKVPIHTLTSKEILPLRSRIQIIFQDSSASLNPRMYVEDIVAEGLIIHTNMCRNARREKVADMLAQVGLSVSSLSRYPHEFSGGQRQRINIARALVLNPEFLVCDEPVSALDAHIQVQVMELLASLKQQRQLTYMFISHDLRAVKAISDTVGVMYLGQIVEQAPVERLFAFPQHPYTQALLSAAPKRDFLQNKKETTVAIKGELPSSQNVPSGCPFHPRCPKATNICRQLNPSLKTVEESHQAACHLLGAGS